MHGLDGSHEYLSGFRAAASRSPDFCRGFQTF
jgi:hypothetical protein